MTKLERAIKEAELLHYIHKYLAAGCAGCGPARVGCGVGLDGKEVFAALKAKYGA